MRHTALKILIFALALTACMGAKAQDAPEVTLRASADSTTLLMGDLVDVQLQVVKNTSEGALVDMPKADEDYYGLELRRCKIDSADLGNGRLQVDYNMQFQAFYPAELITLPPFRYALPDGDTVYSNPLAFKVFPVELDSILGSIEDPANLRIHPSVGPVTVPARWYDYIPDWTLWVMLGLAAVALIVVLYLYFRKNGPAIFVQRKPTPPYELAVQRLAALKDKHLLDQGQVKTYYTELIDIFRSYLQGRFGINAMEMPSKTILKRIRENKEIHLTASQMEQVLQLADYVKFAAAHPGPEDGQRTFSTVSSFVESTKPAPDPEEETPGKGNPKQKSTKN